jgi:hypothetical protein
MTHVHQDAYDGVPTTPWPSLAEAAPGDVDALWPRIAEVLDEAHAELPAPDLAALLLAVEATVEPLERGVGEGPLPRLASPAWDHFATLQPLLRRAAGGPAQRDLAARLRAYLDELAARPRGAAVLTAC